MTSLEKTTAALEKNGMTVLYAETAEQARVLVLSKIPEGAVCASGGSMTLAEAGVIGALKSGNYNYIDRNAPNLTPEEREAAMTRAMRADVYLASANAVTENGEVYNVDGFSNRVSALLYGPKRVILLVSTDKIVKNLDEAILRVKTVAAPKNAKRLNCDTYCAHTGHCVSLDRKGGSYGMTDGCDSPSRICCNYVVMGPQRQKGRVTVVLVGEPLGY